MNTPHSAKKSTVELLNSDFARAMIVDLGISDERPEAQAELISGIGKAIFEGLIHEVHLRLPEDDLPALERLISEGDVARAYEHIRARLPDFDELIQKRTHAIYGKIKARADEIARKRGATG